MILLSLIKSPSIPKGLNNLVSLLNDVTKKDRYPILFCDEILQEVRGHELYSFADEYNRYHQVKIASEDQCNTIFTSP